jgi:hypothetical protein
MSGGPHLGSQGGRSRSRDSIPVFAKVQAIPSSEIDVEVFENRQPYGGNIIVTLISGNQLLRRESEQFRLARGAPYRGATHTRSGTLSFAAAWR